MAVTTHHLSIAGHRLTVRSPMAPERARRLAEMVSARAQEAVEAGAGSQGAILLAALALADEVLRRRESDHQDEASALGEIASLQAELVAMASGATPPAEDPEP